MISQKHLIYLFLNSCFIFMSIALFYFEQGYMFTLYLASLALLLSQLISQLNLRSLFFWFVLCYIALFYLSPLAEFIFPGEVIEGTQRSINIYHFLNITSIHLLSFFYFVVYKKRSDEIVILLNINRFNFALVLMGIITIISALWMLISVGGFSAINMTRVDLKYVQGGKGLALLLSYFASVFFVLLGIFLANKKFNIVYLILALALLVFLELIYFIALRNRTMILTHLLAIPVGFYINRKIHFTNYEFVWHKKFFIKLRAFPLILSLALLALLGMFVRFARGIYLEGTGSVDMSLKDMLIVSVKAGDLGYANMVIKIFDFAFIHDFVLNGQSYYRLLLAFVPKIFYNKTIPTTDSLIGQMLTGLDVMTIPPGVFGDAYLNFGYWGILVFAVYGWFLGLWDSSKKYISNCLFFAISFTFIYHFVRGSFVNVIISLVIVYLGVFLVTKILKPQYIPVN